MILAHPLTLNLASTLSPAILHKIPLYLYTPFPFPHPIFAAFHMKHFLSVHHIFQLLLPSFHSHFSHLMFYLTTHNSHFNFVPISTCHLSPHSHILQSFPYLITYPITSSVIPYYHIIYSYYLT